MPKHYRPPGKKKEGNAAKYITRNKALNRLQLKLPEFRRLCILKGIFPREPKKKLEGNNKTYYHMKDIAFLAHEPLLLKSREIKAFEKKIKKALAKKNKKLAVSLQNNKPSYTLDHIVRQRYPTFIDALRDLDDALTMIHLFAALPAEKTQDIPVERVHSCRRLSLEWQVYISRKHCLRKTFVSVKGIYYQAEVEGQTVTWLTPHVLHQVLPSDVDFRVMLTFVEFYETLMGFVNFKLYSSILLKYPPVLDPQLEAAAAELYAMVKGLASNTAIPQEDSSDATLSNNTIESEVDELEQKEKRLAESQARLALLQHQLSTMDKETDATSDWKHGDMSIQAKEQTSDGEDEDEETKFCRTLFKGLKFFLGREVPRESLLFVIPAFGGIASWDGYGAPFQETDESITHQIVDRPTQGHKYLSRDYVQPQWIYDCVNARLILPTEDYMVGRVLPPHLSPFVNNELEGYLPEYAETIKRLQVAEKKQLLPMPGMEDEDMTDPQNMLADAVARRNEANEATEKEKVEIVSERVYQEDLAKELQGVPYSASLLGTEKEELQEAYREENSASTGFVPEKDTDDSKAMSKIMMSGKKRKLYEAMQMGKAKKKAHVKLLEERKHKADKVGKKD